MKKRILNISVIYTTSIIFIILIVKFLIFINFKCFYRELFHIYCPGCGTTRMINSLLNFRIIEAFGYNPLMFVLGIISSIYIIYSSFIYVKTGRIIIPKIKTFIIIAIILIVYMILRNIPAFNFLAP